jgi:hypothetical protein
VEATGFTCEPASVSPVHPAHGATGFRFTSHPVVRTLPLESGRPRTLAWRPPTQSPTRATGARGGRGPSHAPSLSWGASPGVPGNASSGRALSSMHPWVGDEWGPLNTAVENVFVYRDGAKRCSCAPLPVVLGAVSPCVLCTPHWGLLHLRRAGWVREAHAAGVRRGAHEHTVRSADGVGAAVWSHCVPTSSDEQRAEQRRDTGHRQAVRRRAWGGG